VHSLTNDEDLAKIEAKGGVLETLHKLRDLKVTRFLGITSHTDPVVLAKALERNDFDCTQMALNAALVGLKSGSGGDMAINLAGQAPSEKLLYYALSLPVALAVVRMPTLEMLEQNVAMAKAFKPMPKPEMKELSQVLSSRNKMALDRYFSNHIDA